MLRLLGPPRTPGGGLSRRDLLHVGGLGAFGLSVSDFMHHAAAGVETDLPREASSGRGHFGRAKACILLFPYGSPPQHETFDPKPDAPAEIQGELKSIQTNVPGMLIGEGLPRIAKVMDRVTVVRSVTHPYPEHGVAYAVSGIPTYTPALETRPRDPRHWPFIGSVVDYVEAKRSGRPVPEVPRNVGLPWLLNSRTDLNVSAGPYAAFLGQRYDPVWADFDGAGTRVAPKYTDGQTKEFHDPFAGCTAGGRFRLTSAGQLPPDVTPARLDGRRTLLEQFDRSRSSVDERATAGGFDAVREMAFSLVTANRVRDALDVTREPLATRER